MIFQTLTSSTRMTRRSLCGLAIAALWPLAGPAAADGITLNPEGLRALQRGGAILVMRHAATSAGSSGDPPGFELYNCSTQRNLSDEGREQAAELGRALQAANVRFGTVMSSEWCRAFDTAQLIFGVTPATWDALNYTFPDDKALLKARTQVRNVALGWRGPDNLALVTHTNNVLALSGKSAAMNQAFVLVPIKGTSDFAVLPLN